MELRAEESERDTCVAQKEFCPQAENEKTTERNLPCLPLINMPVFMPTGKENWLELALSCKPSSGRNPTVHVGPTQCACVSPMSLALMQRRQLAPLHRCQWHWVSAGCSIGPMAQGCDTTVLLLCQLNSVGARAVLDLERVVGQAFFGGGWAGQ